MKKKKNWIWPFIGIFSIGAIAPTISLSGKQSFSDKLTTVTKREYRSFASSLYNRKFASDDELTGDTITLKRLNDYINISKTKLTYKLLFAGASNPQVQNIVGTYLHNVTPTNNLDKNGLQEQYIKIQQENEKVGLDVVDFDEFKNYTAPIFIDNYLEGYKNTDGVSLKQVENLKQILLSSYSNIGNEAMENLDGQADLSFALADDNSFDQMSPDVDHYQARINAKLQAALKFEQVQFSHNQLQVSDASAEFLKYYSDYTVDGKTTPDSKIKPLQVGDIIPEKLLQYLLTYTYDTVYGADYAEAEYMGFDINPNEIVANANSEYDALTIGLCSYTQPLSSLNCDYCTYGEGEILPGYALELAIKSIEDTSNSHECKMVLTKGISYTNSAGKKQTLWDTKDGTLESAKNDTQGDLELTINITSDYIDLIQNISKNLYYQNESIDLSSINDFSLNSNNAYFDSSKNKRKKLDEILADYTGDVYDFKKVPFFITGTDIENVLPDGVKFPVNSLDENLHTNQHFALIPTLVDSNVYTMTLRCGYIDTVTNDKNVEQQVNTFVAAYIPFVLNDSRTVDQINVQFDISQDLKAKIEYSQEMYRAMSMLYNLGKMYKGSDEELENIDGAIKSIKSSRDWHISYVVLSSIALAANFILSAYYAVIATLQFFAAFSVATAAFAIFAIAGLALAGYALVKVIKEEKKVIKQKNSDLCNLNKTKTFLGDTYGQKETIFVRNTFTKIAKDFSTQFDSISKNYNPLFESNATFANKRKAADIVIGYTNNEEFLANFKECLENDSTAPAFNGMSLSECCKPIDFSKVEYDNNNNFIKKALLDSNEDTERFEAIKQVALIYAEGVPTFIATCISVLETLPESSIGALRDLVQSLKLFEALTKTEIASEVFSGSLVVVLQGSNPLSLQSVFDMRDIRAYELDEYRKIINNIFNGKEIDFENSFKKIWNKAIYYNLTDSDGQAILKAYQDGFKAINRPDLAESFASHVSEIIQKEGMTVKDFFGPRNFEMIGTKKFFPNEHIYCIAQSEEVGQKFAFTVFDKSKNILKERFMDFVKNAPNWTEEFKVPAELKNALLTEEFSEAFDKNLKGFSSYGLKVNIKSSFFRIKTETVYGQIKTAFFAEHAQTMKIAQKARALLEKLDKFTISLNPAIAIVIALSPTILDIIKLALEHYNIM